MQAWHVHQYDPVWYETEYVSPSEVKILVESELLKRLKKIHFASTSDTSFWSYKNYLTSVAIKKTMKEYIACKPNFGTFQDFDDTIYYELVDNLMCNYILISRNYRMIKKWVKNWVIFKLYHPPGITRTSVTGKIYGNANGGLRYRTSRDRFRQLKYKMNRKDDE
jgi:ATP-dependent Lon protease